MIYFKEGGWWLPDGEEHLQQWMLTKNVRYDGRLTYQFHKYTAALEFVRRRRMAVDVGAHVGLWSWHMARDFAHLEAFEPMSAHRECWKVNMGNVMISRAQLHPYALGTAGGKNGDDLFVRVVNRTANSSGDTGVEVEVGNGERTPPGSELVAMRTLDSFEFPVVDFLKVDCEGFELYVMRGAIETLRRCKPAIIVEQKPETGMEKRYGIGTTDAVAFLEGLGAKRRKVLQGDYIMSWDE